MSLRDSIKNIEGSILNNGVPEAVAPSLSQSLKKGAELMDCVQQQKSEREHPLLFHSRMPATETRLIINTDASVYSTAVFFYLPPDSPIRDPGQGPSPQNQPSEAPPRDWVHPGQLPPVERQHRQLGET